MNRVEILIAKIETLERLNAGELLLTNPSMSTTTTFSNFIRFLLDEWPTKVSPEDARMLAPAAQAIMSHRYPPDRSRIEWTDPRLVALLSIRWLLRHKHLQLTADYLGEDWKEFTSDYIAMLSSLGDGGI